MFAVGLVPAMIDYGQTYAGSREDSQRFTPDGAPGKMQLAFEGYREAVTAATRRALSICMAHGARRLPWPCGAALLGRAPRRCRAAAPASR